MRKKPKVKTPCRETIPEVAVVSRVREPAFFWGAIVVILLTFALYANTLGNSFVWDDNANVLIPKRIAEIPGAFLTDLWGTGGGGHYYRPMVGLFYNLTMTLFGNGPFGFHLVNIITHTSAVLMVYLIADRFFRGCSYGKALPIPIPAGATALLFAAHPIHSESVAWMSGITDPSCSFFMLFSFYCYLLATDEGDSGSQRIYFLLSLGAFFIATLCKEVGATLPLLIVLYDFALRRQAAFSSPRRYLLRLLPFSLVAVLYLGLRWHALAGLALGGQNQGLLLENAGAGLDVTGYLINALPFFMQYLGKLLLPINLSVYYSFKPIASLLEPVGLFAILTVTGFALATWYALKRDRAIFFAMVFIVIPLLPALHFRSTGLTAFADRYLYLPVFGYVLLLVLIMARVADARHGLHKALMAACVVLFCLYSVGTFVRNGVWKNNHNLWADAEKKSPDAVFPRFCLAHTLKAEGKLSAAIEQYQAAITLNPQHASAHVNLGNAYAAQGNLSSAAAALQTAVSLAPNLVDASYNLGTIYLRMGEPAKAVEQFSRTLSLQPDSAKTHNNLGTALLATGNTEKALEHFRIAARLEPDNQQFRRNLAITSGK